MFKNISVDRMWRDNWFSCSTENIIEAKKNDKDGQALYKLMNN